MATLTATASEARANFSQIASGVFETGQPVTVFKNSKPWVEIVPSGFLENASEEDDEYIERVASAVRKSKQEFAQGKSYKGSEALLEMLKEKRPEVWA